MRLLFLGDIVGRCGRDAIQERLPELRRELALDFVVANGENAAAGFGITQKICNQLFDAGVDVITGGNHSWDQREVMAYINQEPRLLRPQNFPAGTPGRGHGLFTVGGRKVLVAHVLGQVFMKRPFDDPFSESQPESPPASFDESDPFDDDPFAESDPFDQKSQEDDDFLDELEKPLSPMADSPLGNPMSIDSLKDFEDEEDEPEEDNEDQLEQRRSQLNESF